ncbi:MAG: chemotaxis protein CheW, partial [Coriobacteriales bacterium]|nr:chemotaxis protein CheW [Coriobacteriales bacterium]
FLFTLGNERYAVPVERVERLVSLPFCAPAPLPLPYLVGLANYRNHAIAVFDLAKAAGALEPSPYALIVSKEDGDLEGLTVTSALGVRSMREAILADEQPQPRALTGNLRTACVLKLGPKEPPITLLTHC